MEPDLVIRMRLGGLSDGHFSYGPVFSGLVREPFSSERHMFGDSRFHSCGPYLEMERKFFSDNEAIMREFYFDPDLLLGDPAEDVAVEEVVNYEDLVPAVSADEILGQLAAVNNIMNVKIVRLAPVDSDSENKETTGRVTSLVVVEAVGEPVGAGEATGSAVIGVNDVPVLAAAAGGGDVGETAEGWAEVPSDPGPSGGDVSMDDFLPRPRLGLVPLPSSSDAAGDEVILYFLCFIQRSILLLNC